VGAHAVLSVFNTSPPIPPAEVDLLFQPFHRGGADRTRGRDGLGLGLSIVRGLVAAQKGQVWFEPLDPHGSCFGIRLPGGSP